LTVIECPKCGSKFKIEKNILAKETIKMRCSVCSHVFTHSLTEKGSFESDFDLLIGTNDGELQDKPLQEDISLSLSEDLPPEAAVSEITEAREEEGGDVKEAPPLEEEVQPESVIREIDTILGASEAVPSDEGKPLEVSAAKGMSVKAKAAIAVAVLVLLGVGFVGVKVILPHVNKSQKELEAPVLERGPFFSIPDGSVTYEILTNDNEGSVLVVKGVIKKLTAKPLKSILVEARMYDQANTLMESRTAYAGIVPESAELMRQKGSDIDLLLTAEPRTLGVLETSQDIPFAVAFFGKPAREASSFKVEVKEFHWK
jgi:predicted Zn finger-like uncharacterized protein